MSFFCRRNVDQVHWIYAWISLLNIIIIVSYIVFFFLSRIPHLEFGLAASLSLLQKHSLTGVTSFEAYVSDVIECRFEKVRIGRRFEDWMRLDVDLSLTYIHIYIYCIECIDWNVIKIQFWAIVQSCLSRIYIGLSKKN
jgi:hypothetical protein